jgi:hypothetical protein
MNKLIALLTILSCGIIPLAAQNRSTAEQKLGAYNITWTSQSLNSAGSMPCGGGDIGLNVWVEKGDLLFYLAESGMFDENNQLLKAGRVRLHIDGNPFGAGDFKQQLRLREGGITISGGNTTVLIWVDVFRPVIHVSVESAKRVNFYAAYESWRYADHIILGTEFRANSYKVRQKTAIKTYRDSIAFKRDALVFYHHNAPGIENIFDYTVRMEGMDTVKSQLYDPLTNNTFGGVMKGVEMQALGNDTGRYAGIPYRAWVLKSRKPSRTHQLEIALHTAQTTTPQAWNKELDSVITEAAINQKTALTKTRLWWSQFWNRSYIFIDGPDSFITRNYQLFRYQLACNAYSKWPTKFNGGLFTFDPIYVDAKQAYSPDFRLWGGGTMTAQNQRLLYFPMLKSGDADLMKAQFDFYLRILNNAVLRSKVYWGHGGACFTEQIENFGLPDITEYGLKRPPGSDPGLEYNPWLEYLWETVFEFCFMILETERYENADIHRYMPLIDSCLVFFDEHYRQLAAKRGSRELDEAGRYIFYPSSAAETYKMTYNSTTVVSALQVVLSRLLELPGSYADSTQRLNWAKMLQRIPAIPLREMNGHTMLAPAQAWARVQNTEAPQLYPVYPWGLYGIGKPGLDTAINTYRYDTLAVKFRSYIGWKQYNIFAARLGLRDEAEALTREKFRDGPHRFPSFWGPGFDWTPDHNWGGSAMIGLQEMLLQANGKTIYLLPAWPRKWNAHFKLHAPYQTIVQGTIRDGKIEDLEVFPAERKKDVIILGN